MPVRGAGARAGAGDYLPRRHEIFTSFGSRLVRSFLRRSQGEESNLWLDDLLKV